MASLSRDELAEQWGALYGAPPPPRTSRSLMLRAVAYKLQERVYGGLSPTTRRLLMGSKPTVSARPRAPDLRSGSVLLREWRGITHRVSVIEGGFLYDGKRFASLSEIARTITGSRWSGPRFFGLRANDKA